MTQHFNRRNALVKRKVLRNNATDAERRLWRCVKGENLGVKFRRQYSVDAYILDFYAPRAKLAVEVDGALHFSPEAKLYDQERTAHLNRFGIEVLRFTNLEIAQNLEGVLTSIAEAVSRRIHLPPPPSLRRRG